MGILDVNWRLYECALDSSELTTAAWSPPPFSQHKQAQVQPNQPHPTLFLSTKNITAANSHRRPVRVSVTTHVICRSFAAKRRTCARCSFSPCSFLYNMEPTSSLPRQNRVLDGASVEVELEQLYAYRGEASTFVFCLLFCRRAPCNDKWGDGAVRAILLCLLVSFDNRTLCFLVVWRS